MIFSSLFAKIMTSLRLHLKFRFRSLPVLLIHCIMGMVVISPRLSKEKMAATIKDTEEDTSKRKHIKAVLVNKLEGCSDTVNMAVTIPHEDAVISVSDDK